MRRVIGQIGARVVMILLAGVVVAGLSYAFSLTPAAAVVTSAVQSARGGGPSPGAAASGGAGAANPAARRGANPNASGAANTGAAPAGQAGGGRPADLARGLPEFGRYVATLAVLVFAAVLLGKGLTLLTGATRRRQHTPAT